MIDGTYNVMLKTPMGVKKGELVFSTQGSELIGKLVVMGNDNPFVTGSVNGNQFAFTGEIKTAMGKVSYECTGSVDGDSLEGVAKTKKGNMSLSGKRK